MSGRRRRGRGELWLPGALERAMTPPRRASLPGVIWAWRNELAVGAGIAILLTGVVHTLGVLWAITGLSAVAGVFSPPWPGWLRALWWQFRTPHLLRSGLHHARIQNSSGRGPLIVRVTGEPFGERVRLWCPAGTSAEDLYAAQRILRAACHAADVRVTRDERRSHIVTVDVIRRTEPGQAPDGEREPAS